MNSTRIPATEKTFIFRMVVGGSPAAAVAWPAADASITAVGEIIILDSP